MGYNAIRRFVRRVLVEEIGRNFHTVNTEPISYKDFADYEVDIIMLQDGGYIVSILYKGKKLTPIRKYSSKEEAEFAAEKLVSKHRISNES